MSRSSGVLFMVRCFWGLVRYKLILGVLRRKSIYICKKKQDADAILKNYKKRKNRVRSRHAHIYTV
ncbi:hypothetical protein DWY31_07255 [Dorea sp. AF24-7LB]|uniref:hypothetical protein n=1 Tax=Dorea sp. AF24-7LB TaxID=2293097 RepID=UPI000E4E7470|nr:hypothetical protein [Dorea sp. AF24-7LB]RHQ55732.1 hypothetical protein DWY31_07255 [Dorea sp. AF24-7LB]